MPTPSPTRYRTTNWSDYNAALRKRGSLSVWFPPYYGDASAVTRDPADRLARIASDPVFVRHCRDHWTKWPGAIDWLRAAYRTESTERFRIMGGVNTIKKQLQALPESWEAIPYDSISVAEFLNDGDIYLNANNETYIKEFGRNVMEAFAFGLPVIAEPVFAETFGEAVLSMTAERSEPIVDRLRSDPALAKEQIEKGRAFVRRHCSDDALRDRLMGFLG